MRLRFSIRMVLVVTGVIAICFAIPFRKAARQKRGREWVASQSGHVTFAHKFNRQRNAYQHAAEFEVPDWCIQVFGIDLFDSVDTVILDNMMVEDLTPITDLEDLRSLAIIIEIDDQLDFRPLQSLTSLEHLHLDYTNISAERLAFVRELLRDVRVEATNHPPREVKAREPSH